MKKIISLIIFFFIIFIINVIFFYTNENYNFIVKTIKYGDELVFQTKKEITIDYTKETKDTKKITQDNIEDFIFDDVLFNKNQEEQKNEEKNKDFIVEKEIEEIDNNIQHIDFILKLFSRYDLLKGDYDEKYNSFGLKQYFEQYYEVTPEFEIYKNKDFEIYFLKKRTYKEIKDSFIYFSNRGFYTINETNNFGKKSFFINTNNNDGYVRIIIDSGITIFGLYLKKSYYEEVKNLLQSI